MWCPPRRIGLALLACALSAQADDRRFGVAQADWSRYVEARAVIELDAVRGVLERFEERPGARVVVRHPGGSFGVRWADELRRWLVAFGVPSRYVVLEPGSGAPDVLYLAVSAGE